MARTADIASPASTAPPAGTARRCLVTGASGFVGAAVCRRLLARGWTVHAVARRRPERVPAGCASVTTADLREAGEWLAQLDHVDAVVHAAGHAHSAWDGSAVQRERIIAANLQPSALLARETFRRDLHLVLLSSASVFGDASPQPLTPDSPTAPRGPYAMSKYLAEQAVRKAAAAAPGRWTILRPPLVYGPGVQANFLRLMRWIDRGWSLPLGAVNNRRSLIGVDNLADLAGAVLCEPRAYGRVVLPADGDWATPALIRALAQALDRQPRLLGIPEGALRGIAAVTGRIGLNRIAAPLRTLTASLALRDDWLTDELGWQPPQRAADGFAATAAWFRSLGRAEE
ncbi:MAG: NAD-dependent epimerase/dehydratase family protein [Burkholderiaceae bacterium]